MTQKIRGFEPVSKYDINDVILPKRATKHSAGYDAITVEAITIPADQIKLVSLGIKAYMQPDEVLYAYNRSSNPRKLKVSLANCVGVIDSDYYNNEDNEGEIFLQFENLTNEPITLNKHTACGQLIFQKILLADGDSFDNGARRTGGFGSTDK